MTVESSLRGNPGGVSASGLEIRPADACAGHGAGDKNGSAALTGRHNTRMLRVILGEMPLDRQTPAIPDARRDHYLWLQFLKARQTVRRSVLLFLKELDMVRGRLCIGAPEFIAL